MSDTAGASVEQLRLRLAESERALIDVLNNNPDGVVVVDPQDKVLHVNSAAQQIFRISSEQLKAYGLPFPVMPGVLETEVAVAGGDSRLIGIQETSVRWDGVPARVLTLRDMTEERRAKDRLAHEALHDTLTGLPNRSLLVERVDSCLRRSRRRPNYLFGLLFLDMDRFKRINEGLSHESGDRVLVEVGERLRNSIRPSDTVARLGSDAFAVLLDDMHDSRDALRVTARIQRRLAKPISVGEKEIVAGASIGIALAAPKYQSPEEVLQDADTAMHRAKESGRGTYEIFDHSVHQRALDQLELESELRRAVEQGEFVTHFQPIVALDTGALKGFEALVRWQHPQRGMVPPGEFLPAAKEAGLMQDIDLWMLEQSCLQASRWPQHNGSPGPGVSVNVTTRQLSDPGFLNTVTACLDKSGLEPSRLKLEITEEALGVDDAQLWQNLNGLTDRDIRLHVDDFGTGYSSLGRLQELPVDTLKIDKSFVQCIEESSENREIVRTIASLARGLNMDVIAEGVETHAQLQELREAQCAHGQGYLFSKPVMPGEALTLASRRNADLIS